MKWYHYKQWLRWNQGLVIQSIGLVRLGGEGAYWYIPVRCVCCLIFQDSDAEGPMTLPSPTHFDLGKRYGSCYSVRCNVSSVLWCYSVWCHGFPGVLVIRLSEKFDLKCYNEILRFKPTPTPLNEFLSRITCRDLAQIYVPCLPFPPLAGRREGSGPAGTEHSTSRVYICIHRIGEIKQSWGVG